MSENCFRFFEDRIRRNGHSLPVQNFILSKTREEDHIIWEDCFYKSEKNITNGLFIELYSDVNVFQPGYSELLLDKKYHGYSGLKDYSFAKYINGEMVLENR